MDDFKLPIEFDSKVSKINNNILNDIDLYDPSNNNLYKLVFNPKTISGSKVLSRWTNVYSYNKRFLKDSQKLYKEINIERYNDLDLIYNQWTNFKHQTNFLIKYNYVDWDRLKFLNRNPVFLQLLSINTLLSPVLILSIPIIVLFIPYFILKYKNIDITLVKYIEILKQLFRQHPIGQLFNIQDVNYEKKLYIFSSVGLYFFQIYQNIKSAVDFNTNISTVLKEINYLKLFIKDTTNKIKVFISYTSKLRSYSLFNMKLQLCVDKLNDLFKKLSPFRGSNVFDSFINIGSALKIYYELFEDEYYNKIILYAIHFQGYLDNIIGLQENINNKLVNKCKYSTKSLKFKNSYYGLIDPSVAVKNSYNLNKNYLITGPNAAGKTTLLKNTLSNIILGQQIGYGFYKDATLIPFKYIHSYLNIPDTSGRDSLFQAEARRCKEIIDNVNSKKTSDNIFCIFDELYSGTNPYEATASAESFLNYLSDKLNVKYMLTTHYIDICSKLEDNNSNTKNYNMKIIKTKDKLKYTYQLREGISTIKGGVNVLEELNYPSNIIDNTKEILSNSFIKY